MSNFKRYYQNGNIIFVTIVTYNRQPLLIDNIEYLRKSLMAVKYNFKIIAGVVLPDHIHMIIEIVNADDMAKIIGAFKAYFSKLLPYNFSQTPEQKQRREKGIWQRKYYDHIIRNEDDFNKHIDYIHYNPKKHLNLNPKDWKYSSFMKFVNNGFYEENWCNYDDKNCILAMDLE